MQAPLVDVELVSRLARKPKSPLILKIVTFNINGIRARLEPLLHWIKQKNPDIVALQEIKIQDSDFPDSLFKNLGYNIVTNGQKSFNGVAILSKYPIEVLSKELPGDPQDKQARFLEVICENKRILCIYLPNGNPINTEKFSYKLKWMDRFNKYCGDLLKLEEETFILGDFNVIPQKIDCKLPAYWNEDALYDDRVRSKFNYLINIGYLDSVRHVHPHAELFTQWDYRGRAWENNNGVRIDHVLLSPLAADRLENCWIENDLRDLEKPSDHVPVWVSLKND